MDSPLELELTLGQPASRVGLEPREPVMARLRIKPRAEAEARPQLGLCFVLDASASMHRFVLNPEQRTYWQQRAEARGEISRQQADGRTGMVWTGQTLRELQQHVSTPMLSTLRGVWRTLETMQPTDTASVLAFADQAAVIYQEQPGGVETATRLQYAKTALGRLGSGVDESGLGRGTRLAVALQDAINRSAIDAAIPGVRRVILVSDGIVEDREACRPLLDIALEQGIVISVIGVGDEFDEEFLMLIADLTRGSYYYAATAPEVEQAVQKEVGIISRIIGRQGMLRFRPENGTIIQDVFPIAPELSEFQTMWVEDGTWRFRIGDLSSAEPPAFMLRLAPAALPAGNAVLGNVRVEALQPASNAGFKADAPVTLLYTEDPALLQARDDEVLDLARKLEIYLEERRAASAAARGDAESETKHLKAATKMLRSVGNNKLAEEMEQAAAEAEAGTRNLSRTKRVKAGTRRLGNKGG